MPEPDPGAQTANERFDALWEKVGADRVVIGDEDNGVEIRVDADLSIFGIIDKLKEAAKRGVETGRISKDEQKIVSEKFEETVSSLSGGIYDKLYDQLGTPVGKRP